MVWKATSTVDGKVTYHKIRHNSLDRGIFKFDSPTADDNALSLRSPFPLQTLHLFFSSLFLLSYHQPLTPSLYPFCFTG